MAAYKGTIRAMAALTGVNTLLAGSILYNNNQKLERNWEETESRLDEQDLTLRAHIGLIEGSLERIEARQRGDADAESRDGSRIGQNSNYETPSQGK